MRDGPRWCNDMKREVQLHQVKGSKRQAAAPWQSKETGVPVLRGGESGCCERQRRVISRDKSKEGKTK